MGLGKRCESYGSGLVRSTSFGRKRVTLDLDFSPSTISTTPMKKVCSHNSFFNNYEKSLLEALPQDILIRIVCGVDHDDLKRLFHVSKAIREATLIAKKWHFQYSTPRKTIGFKNAIEDLSDDIEAPNAPRQSKIRSLKLSRKKLADISIALFSSGNDHDDYWLQKNSSMVMDIE